MCGIAGLVTGSAADQRTAMKNMLDRLAHRGPDGEGTFSAICDGGRRHMMLGHRRLAIIDVENGAQPMIARGGNLAIVFNGEIYNYVELRNELALLGYSFETGSDTEVLLRAYEQWGEDCVGRLRGMFAFAVWDGERDHLFLARDRFGKKPLYMYEDGDDFIFASEIKAILAVDGIRRRLEDDSVREFLLYRYVPAPNTLFKGIRKLAPGTTLVRRAGMSRERLYYRPHDGHAKPIFFMDKRQAVALFREKLEESIKIRMRSDVPFGAFLSGGLDSSTVVALMSRHSPIPINTFSVGFDGDESGELPFARIVARHFKTNHDEVTLTARNFADLVPEVVRALDAPISEPATVPLHALSLLASKRVKMVLSGEGADEFLGGYPKYLFEPFIPLGQGLLPRSLRAPVLRYLSDLLPYRFRRARILAANFALDDERQRFPRWFGALSQDEVADLAHPIPDGRCIDARPFETDAGVSTLRRLQYFDQSSWLPDSLLERGDRVTMAASIEARMPFMDHELSEFISSLPDSFRVHGMTGKWILREAIKNDLPPEVLARPKAGFPMPLNRWIRGPMRDLVGDLLLDPGARTLDYIRRDPLADRLQEHFKGRRDHTKLLWTLLSFELFQREYSLTRA
jgi:asparagine synthase (glutamine-hydrolysing)